MVRWHNANLEDALVDGVMNLFKKDRSKMAARPSWRDYQKRLKTPSRRTGKKVPMVWAAIAVVMLSSLYLWLSAPDAGNNPASAQVRTPEISELLISKKEVQLLLHRTAPDHLLSQKVVLPFKNERFVVETSLDESLQSRLADAMDRKNSRYIAVVVMEADTGRILSMAGFDKTDSDANPCLKSTFPAASLFKIVTAAAAVDRHHYTCATQMRFNGFKHTLYKSQLHDTNNSYTHTVSFADSFAQSINPVFGKLGQLSLGKQVLEQYAEGFGFNQPIEFELAVPPSHLAIKDTPYHWAEIASGFNRVTTISPVHAAMMVSAVLNEGRMLAPTMVERITDAQGRQIYRSRPVLLNPAMSPEASSVLAEMMETTVQSGTARSWFRNTGRDPVLSKLRIGGKTGSISSDDARFDWFVGYAQAKSGSGQLIVAAMVAHEEFIGTRAGTYARMAMRHYFQNQLALKEGTPDKSKL
jgi:penicillin-binding protein A